MIKRGIIAKSENGFSLIQMSVIVTIMGLGLAATLPGGKEGATIERQLTTEEKLDKIQQAMSGYRAANVKLPCPADGRLAPTDANFGIAAPDLGVCTGATPAASLSGATDVVGGMIPVRTLGLDDSYAVDGYGRRFTYVVDRRATDTTNCTALTSTTSGVQVRDATGTITNTYAAYISHGASGYGAYPSSGASVNTATGQIWPASGTSAAALDPDKRDNASINATPAAAFNAVFAKKERTGSFDDLVRVEGSCCTGASCNTPPYDGPDVALPQYDCDAPRTGFMTYKLNGNNFDPIIPYAGVGPTIAEQVAWSPDNAFLVSGKDITGTRKAVLFKRNGLNFTLMPDNTLPNQPNNHTSSYYWSPDSRFLFVIYCCEAAPALRVYERNGDTFTQYSGNARFNAVMADGFMYYARFSKNSNLMVTSAYSNPGGYFKKLFTYSNGTFTELGDTPIEYISNDGNVGIATAIYSWDYDGGTALRLFRKGSTNLQWNFVNEVKTRLKYPMGSHFSPDGMYFALSASYGTVPFEVLKFSGKNLELLTGFDFYPATNAGYSTFGVSFAYDGKYIAAGAYDYNCASRSAYYYRKVGDMFYYQGFFNNSPKRYAHTWGAAFRN